MVNRSVPAASHEQACARVAALFSSRWLRGYVGSKLRSDPVFPTAYEILRSSAEPILDVGCGVGLLAFYLRARGVNNAITGIDIDERKISRAACVAEQHHVPAVQFVTRDVAGDLPPFSGNVVVFDLLHYLGPTEQQRLLLELAARVAPDASLLLRDCPRDRSMRFRATYAAEIFAQTISWNWRAPLHFPTLHSINAAFSEIEFTRDVVPAWGHTPFNNRLFIFRRLDSGAAPVTG